MVQASGMADGEHLELIATLLYVVGALLFLLVLLCLRISGQLGALLRGGVAKDSGGRERVEEGGVSGVSVVPGSAFDDYLREDPVRAKLPKKEQFAGYREWRREKGMSWGR